MCQMRIFIRDSATVPKKAPTWVQSLANIFAFAASRTVEQGRRTDKFLVFSSVPRALWRDLYYIAFPDPTRARMSEIPLSVLDAIAACSCVALCVLLAPGVWCFGF